MLRWYPRCFSAFLAMLLVSHNLPAQPPDMAEMLLSSARRAYNVKDYPFATERFREFLKKFDGHPQIQSARLGLGLCLVEGSPRDYLKAIEVLASPANDGNFADRPTALFYLGLANRNEGLKQTQVALTATPEAGPAKEKARQRFEEAARAFGDASNVFAKQAKEEFQEDKLAVELEWAARSRCNQAEALLRLNRWKEAQEATAPFIAGQSPLQKSRYRLEGLYYHGLACFQLKDTLAAGKALGLAANAPDADYGSHAKYLLGRVHHLEQERPEAVAAYEGAIAEYGAQKKAAQEALKQPDRFKNDPEEKARLELLVKAPPEHVARATLFLGVMKYEDGQFADALTRFTEFLKQSPNDPLAGEVQLRQGFCQVQLRSFPEAMKTLASVAEKYPKLQDQAWYWFGKAQIQGADPANPAAQQTALKAGVETLRKAADRANQLATGNPPDPEAKSRRAEILTDLADTLQAAKLYKEASEIYKQLVAENLLPNRREEFSLSLVTALHLAGEYAASDTFCQQFQQQYPSSVFLPAIAFRQAENAYFNLLSTEKQPPSPQRDQKIASLLDESIKRYQFVVEKFPEFAQLALARHGLGVCLYRKGELEKAQAALAAIPAADRTGDLAIVPYQLADIYLRLAPAEAEDALTAGRLEEMLKEASDLLDSFIAGNPNAPQVPDALLKLGLCQQRIAGLLAMAEMKNQAITRARQAYDTILQKFAKSEQAPQALLEKAKVRALTGDINSAINDLRAFANEPLRSTKVAPVAFVNLAILLRKSNQFQPAADALATFRRDHEGNLKKDPTRSELVPMLMYHHGVSLREAGKLAEARAILNNVVQQYPQSPEAPEAMLRAAQCARDEAQKKLEDSQQQMQSASNPQQREQAQKNLDAALKEMRDAIALFENGAQKLAQNQPMNPTRARMYYDAAWGFRTLAALEIATARTRLQQEVIQKRREEIAKSLPPGAQIPPIPTPEIPLKSIPLQPSEQGARAQYQATIDAFPDLATNIDARLELSELLGDRGDHDAAIKLIKDALDREPSPELTDKLRVRLAQCLMLKGDFPAALSQIGPVVSNPKSAVYPLALYRAGECDFQMGKIDEAIKRLTPFRDQGPLQGIGGVSDRALLRLGHAFAQKKDWEASRQTLETLIQRFGGSPWIVDAYYGIGWAHQNAGRFEPAISVYNEVTRRTASELAAQAQLNIGLCRLAEKRYGDAATAMLVVPYTYDYPSLSALALLEASRALVEDKKPEQAKKLLERLIKDYPDSESATAARKRLDELKNN